MHPIRTVLCRFVFLAIASAALVAQEEKRTNAIRIDGRIAGYHVETETRTKEAGRELVRLELRSLVKIEVLGSSFDQHIEQTWLLEPDTRAAVRVQSRLTAGEHEVVAAGELGDDGFAVRGGATLDPARVVIAPDLRWLLQRGPKQAGEKVELDWWWPELGSVVQAKVGLAAEPERDFEVLGAWVPVRVYTIAVPAAATELVAFLDRRTGEAVRTEIPLQKLVVERAPAAVVERVERIDLTNGILVRTNLDIEDATVLTAMKLRAVVETGPGVTAESLNVPGQRFTGTVENGRVEGVFEIRPVRHDGAGATPFPVPAGAFAAPELQPFLQPENEIESDDPAIAAKARELAEGAATCFEVVDRLGRWAHDEVPYAIPGGITAKGTFEQRQGDCGGHSRLLAAMLRSLGIPARTPMGGMYVPLHGGSFAQHMWTEVWLGERIGWLPVDCTAAQTTFVDASHIRLATGLTRFAPQSVEVLDHEPKVAAVAKAERRTGAYPFADGETVTWVYRVGGRRIGTESMTYRIADGAHVFTGELDIGDGKLRETTRTEVGDDGRLRAFSAERRRGDESSDLAIAIDGGKATFVRTTDDEKATNAVDVDPSIFVLHDNCMAHFAIPLSRVAPLAEGERRSIRMLHGGQRSAFTVTMRGKGTERIPIGGAEVEASVVEASLVGATFVLHVDERGRMLRFHQPQGDVTIEPAPK